HTSSKRDWSSDGALPISSFTSEPSDVLGAGTPIPIKLRNASKKIAFGTVNIDVTTITPSVLGNMCLNINLCLDAFNVFEANTHSWHFTFKNSPMTTRLIPIQPVIAIANIIVNIDGSKINTNKITTLNVGIDATISIIRCITLSSRPPKNPEIAP